MSCIPGPVVLICCPSYQEYVTKVSDLFLSLSLLNCPLGEEMWLSYTENYLVSINKVAKNNTLSLASTFQVNLCVLFIGPERRIFIQITARLHIINGYF